jgi:hypothetical protein
MLVFSMTFSTPNNIWSYRVLNVVYVNRNLENRFGIIFCLNVNS